MQRPPTAVGKANRTLRLIKHSFAHIDSKAFPLLCKTMVLPHLCNQIWGPFNVADMKLVERVQRQATLIVPELRQLPYGERLKRLQLPTLQCRHRRGDIVMTDDVQHYARTLRPRQGRPLLACSEYAHLWPSTEGRQETSDQPCPAKSLHHPSCVGLDTHWNALPEDVSRAF